MRSTFMGLETSKRGLYTQQSALYTTGHNISNANTLGYSRQRVNMEATSGFPGIGLNAGTMPGFLGTGVEAGSIQRIRDGFVDKQYRNESNQLGYWENRTKNISQMEDVLAEPSKYGLQGSLSDFWQALQTLATNPENGGARAVVVERGVAVADSFNYIHKSLTDIKDNLNNEITVGTKEINSILSQISELNKQIAEVEPNGYLPNDLYDTRDSLLDQLSNYLPIDVSYEKTGGRALAIAEGTVTITLKTLDPAVSITLLQKNEYTEIAVEDSGNEGQFNGAVKGFEFKGAPAAGKTISYEQMQDTGKLKSLVDSYGYQADSGKEKGLYPDMIANLDKMAKEFAEIFNSVHKDGTDLNGKKGIEFFDSKGGPLGASTIKVNNEILNDPNKVAASTAVEANPNNPEKGNGANAKKLGDALFTPIPSKNNGEGLDGFSIQSFYENIIGRLGVEGQKAVKMTANATTLLGAVSNRRDSISSVSLDEEMTDMIRFQQAYNASARMITVMDEALDKIVNGMGLVGR